MIGAFFDCSKTTRAIFFLEKEVGAFFRSRVIAFENWLIHLIFPFRFREHNKTGARKRPLSNVLDTAPVDL